LLDVFFKLVDNIDNVGKVDGGIDAGNHDMVIEDVCVVSLHVAVIWLLHSSNITQDSGMGPCALVENHEDGESNSHSHTDLDGGEKS